MQMVSGRTSYNLYRIALTCAALAIAYCPPAMGMTSAGTSAGGPKPSSGTRGLAKYLNIDPKAKCEKNLPAANDLAEDGYTSTCVSAYEALKEIAIKYQAKESSTESRINTLLASCKSTGQAEDTKCMADAYADAAKAKKELIDFLVSSKEEAKEQKKKIRAVIRRYEHDKKLMEEAKAEAIKKMNEIQPALAEGDVSAIKENEKLVTAIDKGEAVAGGELSVGNNGEVKASNGGAPTITSSNSGDTNNYMAKVGTLIREQNNAVAETESFSHDASTIQTKHQADYENYSAAAVDLSSKTKALGTVINDQKSPTAGKRGAVPPGITKTAAGNGTGASKISDGAKGTGPGNAAVRGDATAKAAGNNATRTAVNNTGNSGVRADSADNFSSDNSSSANPLPSGGGDAGGGLGALGGLMGAAGGQGSSGSSTSADTNPSASPFGAGTSPTPKANLQAQSVDGAVEKNSNENSKAAEGNKHNGFVAGNGDLPVASEAQISGSEKKSGGLLGSTGRSIASSFTSSLARFSGSASKSSDSRAPSALKDVSGNQFKAVGSLGEEVTDLSASSSEAPAMDSLDDLFSPSSESSIPKVGGNTVRSVMRPFSAANAARGETDSQGALAQQASADSSLFDRAHDAHERAQKRGLISLLHKKL